MNERGAILFYESFYKAISGLEAEEFKECVIALMEYGLYGNEIELSGVANMFFTMAKPQIDANNRRYENGKKGGRKPKKKSEEPEAIQNETEQKPSNELADEIVIDDTPFKTFWQLYPRKESERYANSAFATAMLEAEPETIIAGLKKVIDLRWSKYPPEEREYIPKAEKWLKGRGWLDEVKPYVPKKKEEDWSFDDF